MHSAASVHVNAGVTQLDPSYTFVTSGWSSLSCYHSSPSSSCLGNSSGSKRGIDVRAVLLLSKPGVFQVCAVACGRVGSAVIKRAVRLHRPALCLRTVP